MCEHACQCVCVCVVLVVVVGITYMAWFKSDVVTSTFSTMTHTQDKVTLSLSHLDGDVRSMQHTHTYRTKLLSLSLT